MITVDPWPGSKGGVHSDKWGDNIKLYVTAEIAPGPSFTMGTHAADRLNRGNVMGRAGSDPIPPSSTGTLAVDLSCDVIELTTHMGATEEDGIFARTEAGTVEITLADPERIYDPLNRDSPYWYRFASRLQPGVVVKVWAERRQTTAEIGGTILRTYPIFTGYAVSWSEDWRPHPWQRTCQLVAADAIDIMSTMQHLPRTDADLDAALGTTFRGAVENVVHVYGNYPELTVTYPLGNGTDRYITPMPLGNALSEDLQTVTDLELGFSYVDGSGTLQCLERSWYTATPTAFFKPIGCQPGTATYDIAMSAVVEASPQNMVNAVYVNADDKDTWVPPPFAGIVLKNTSSIAKYREHAYQNDDAYFTSGPGTNLEIWAETILVRNAYPDAGLREVTVRCALDDAQQQRSYADVLPLHTMLARTAATVVWVPPDDPTATAYAYTARVIAIGHSITVDRWDTTLGFMESQQTGNIFKMGSNPNAFLDAGFVLKGAA